MTTTERLADDYALLGVGWQASPREIRQAYRRLARECHPDRCAPDPPGQQIALETMQRVNGAFRRVRSAPLRLRVARATSSSEHQRETPVVTSAPRPVPVRGLSREEIERMVVALRTPTPVDMALGFSLWVLTPPLVGLVASTLFGVGGVSLCGLAVAGGAVRCLWLGLEATPGLERLVGVWASRLTSGEGR